MEFKDNIFLKAALTGKIESPSGPSTQSLNNASKQKAPTKRKRTKNKDSELEDFIIVKAVEMKGRDWRAVLTFMKQNCEILGKHVEFYQKCEVGDRGMQDRLRIRASLLLKKDKEK